MVHPDVFRSYWHNITNFQTHSNFHCHSIPIHFDSWNNIHWISFFLSMYFIHKSIFPQNFRICTLKFIFFFSDFMHMCKHNCEKHTQCNSNPFLHTEWIVSVLFSNFRSDLFRQKRFFSSVEWRKSTISDKTFTWKRKNRGKKHFFCFFVFSILGDVRSNTFWAL